MFDLDTIRKMNNESGDAEILGKGTTYNEIKAAADAERDMDAEWPEPRNEF